MDQTSCYEKLSINTKSSKKYGSTTSRNNTRQETYVKHAVSASDTLQGIALKYGVTMEQIRRANRLWASDSLFLREHLLIPMPLDNKILSPTTETADTPTTPSSSSQITSPNSYDNESLNEFLIKIDASIASTKEDVRKVQGSSKFVLPGEYGSERRKPVSRMKQIANNNGGGDILATPQAVVMTQGSKVRTSLQRNEKLQEDLFEL